MMQRIGFGALLSVASLMSWPAVLRAGQVAAGSASRFTLAQVWTLDAMYADARHGVTFRYPATWQAAMQFGYHPPALTGVGANGTKPIAGFGYQEGGFPRQRIVGPYAGTNLEGVGIVYTALSARDAAQCETAAAKLTEVTGVTRVTLGGRVFSVRQTEDAGMSQSTSGRLYATYAAKTCYLFETGVAVSSGAVGSEITALTVEQSHEIERHLAEIVESVRIVPVR